MKINKEELKKALEIVRPGLANKEIIEQSTSFAFINGNVVTYNDEISVSHPIKDLEIEGAIQAEELYKFVSKVNSEEIDLTVTDDEIILKAGRAKSGFKLVAKIVLPLDEELSTKGKWFDIPDKFLEYLKFASMSCSSDMSDPKLTCVHVNKKGFLESSDNFRITHCTLLDELPIETFLLPEGSVGTVCKLKPVKISEGNGWVHFKTENETMISCRTFKEKFVDTSIYLKPVKKGIKIDLPESLNEILDRALIFSKREQIIEENVEIEINEKFLKVHSRSESSWFEESARIAYKGEPILFSVTPYLLKDILSRTNQCTLVDKLLHFSGEGWVYITSLRSIK